MTRKFWTRRAEHLFSHRRTTSPDSRPKEFYDNAIPSGNSVAASALLRPLETDGRPANGRSMPVSYWKNMADRWRGIPRHCRTCYCVLDFYLSRSKEIAIIGIRMKARPGTG